MTDLTLKIGAVTIAEAERRVILATLKHLKGNKRQTAIRLAIDERTLHNKLREYAGKPRYQDMYAKSNLQKECREL
jgi:DNA-binding NtrC family response regulator